ncbi:MAG TPA: hypothetical protein VGP99_12890, partial [Tepidisphaeraceae bacterium]|nr:hypothetical protein [Tepidisphaeraceae bacterium]
AGVGDEVDGFGRRQGVRKNVNPIVVHSVLILAARDRGDEGQFIAVLERGVGLGVGAVEGEGDVVEMIGQSGDAIAHLLDGVGDGGFFGEIQFDMVGAGAVFEEGEKANGDTHGMVC